VIHVRAWGPDDAPPVVCLHGATAHGGQFRRLAEERLAARFHVLAPDLRGFGRSHWDPPWTLEHYVDDVLSVAPPRADWIGLSFGGRLLLELAAREPERVSRAVLLDPVLQLPEHVSEDMADWTARAPNTVEVDGEPHDFSREATITVMRELARELPALTHTPTLLVLADQSYLPGAWYAEELERRLPELEVVRVPGEHNVLLGAFDETAAAVERFLR
jgi:lipase